MVRTDFPMVLGMLLALLAATGCGGSSSDGGEGSKTASVVIENAFDPTMAPVGIAKVAYGGAAWDFVASGLGPKATSTAQSVPDQADTAYAVVQFGWSAGKAFTALDIIKTSSPVDPAGGRVVFSFSNHVGKCGGTPPLSKADYEAIRKEHFADVAHIEEYDAIKCP